MRSVMTVSQIAAFVRSVARAMRAGLASVGLELSSEYAPAH